MSMTVHSPPPTCPAHAREQRTETLLMTGGEIEKEEVATFKVINNVYAMLSEVYDT